MMKILNHDWLLPGYLAVCLFLGGASAAGALANGLINFLAILLLAAIWFFDDRGRQFSISSTRKWLDAFILVIIGWSVLQIIPLPNIIWANLPGRSVISESLEMFGNETSGWRSIALEREYALSSMLSFLPPLAILGLGLRAGRRSLYLSVYLIIAFALLSTALGTLQLLQGPDSPLYFYDISSKSTSTGFFANSNHLATLLLISMVFAASAVTLENSGSRRKSTLGTQAFVWSAVTVYLAINLLINRSLAGFGLAMVAIAYFVLMLWGSWRGQFPDGRKLALVIVASVIAFPFVIFGAYDSLSGFIEQSTRPDVRILFNNLTWQAVKDFFPFGTGLGNFRWIYSAYEADAILQSNYVNHVHNDWHELLLQGGIFAIIIVGLFFWILCRHLVNEVRDEGLLDKPDRWAPYLALLMVLLHSVVDYPLRTAAISAIATICFIFIIRGLRFNPRGIS